MPVHAVARAHAAQLDVPQLRDDGHDGHARRSGGTSPPTAALTIENNVFTHSMNGSGWHVLRLPRARRDGPAHQRARRQQHVRDARRRHDHRRAHGATSSIWANNIGGGWDCLSGVTYAGNVGKKCDATDVAVTPVELLRPADVLDRRPRCRSAGSTRRSSTSTSGPPRWRSTPAARPTRRRADRDGNARSGAPDAGAYEYGGDRRRPRRRRRATPTRDPDRRATTDAGAAERAAGPHDVGNARRRRSALSWNPSTRQRRRHRLSRLQRRHRASGLPRRRSYTFTGLTCGTDVRARPDRGRRRRQRVLPARGGRDDEHHRVRRTTPTPTRRPRDGDADADARRRRPVDAAGGPADLYISPTGSDSAGCTSAAPCASFTRAYNVAASGKVVQVGAGVYQWQTIPAGTKTVTFRGVSGNKVRSSHIDCRQRHVRRPRHRRQHGHAHNRAVLETSGEPNVTIKNSRDRRHHRPEGRPVRRLVEPGVAEPGHRQRRVPRRDPAHLRGPQRVRLLAVAGPHDPQLDVHQLRHDGPVHHPRRLVGPADLRRRHAREQRLRALDQRLGLALLRRLLVQRLVREPPHRQQHVRELRRPSSTRQRPVLRRRGPTTSAAAGAACPASPTATTSAPSATPPTRRPPRRTRARRRPARRRRRSPSAGSNPPQYDFRLRADSIAINAGTSAYAPATDRDGKPRNGAPDAGAYEC